MGNQLACQKIFLRINICRTTHNHSKWTNFRFSLKHCQRLTQCNTFQDNSTFPTLKSSNFCHKTKSSKQMSTESLSCLDEKQQTDNWSASSHVTGCVKPLVQSKDATEGTLSKRAQKRLARAQKHKEFKKAKKETIQRDDVGYRAEDLQQSSYYFENGVRKVYPYTYVFATHAKGRWVGRKIQDVLGKEFGYDQPDDLMKSFEKSLIHVNGRQASVDYVLRNNDYISHRIHRHENPVTAAPIEIIENNKDVVVINKPASIPCHPCGRYRFNSVVFILGKEMGLVNLRNIYRLDRLTSGVLILGKTPERTRMLMDQVVNRQVQKEYVCRVVGKFPDGTVKVDQPLAALSNKLRLQIVSPTGKASQTTFTRISYNGKSSVVRCIPHTGRTHQIRVHLQYLGHPILNDVFYNSDAWGPSRGKNGVYEVPHDQVCEQIWTSHQDSLWMAGDNPLYEEKLKQMREKEDQRSSMSDSSTLADYINVSYNKCSDVYNATVSCESSQKKMHEHTVPSNDAEILPENSSGRLINSSDEITVDPQTPSSSRSEVTIDSQTCSNHSIASKDQTPETISTTDSSSCQERARLPGFKMSDWSVDPSCDLCKRLHVDPQEKHLVMFLHAIKYKGPGWEYETALPEWASEDWCREEEFILGNENCFMS